MAGNVRISDGIQREFVIEPALDAIQDARQTINRFTRRQTAAHADAVLEDMYQGASRSYFAGPTMPGQPTEARERVQQHYMAKLQVRTDHDLASIHALKEDIQTKYLHTCCVVSLFQSWCVFGLLGFGRSEATRGVIGEPCPATSPSDWGRFKWHLYHRVHAMLDAYLETRLDPDELFW